MLIFLLLTGRKNSDSFSDTGKLVWNKGYTWFDSPLLHMQQMDDLEEMLLGLNKSPQILWPVVGV